MTIRKGQISETSLISSEDKETIGMSSGLRQDGHAPLLVWVLHLEHNTLSVVCRGFNSGQIPNSVVLLTFLVLSVNAIQ